MKTKYTRDEKATDSGQSKFFKHWTEVTFKITDVTVCYFLVDIYQKRIP